MAATSALPAYPPRARAWASALIIFVITAIAMADRMAISMLIGPIKREFALGDLQASLLVGLAFTLFYILFLIPIGWAADRISRRRVLGWCLLVWSLATVACGFAGGFLSLFLLRMLVGAGEAGLAPSVQGILGASFPREALAKPIALQGIGFQVGSALGLAAAGAVLAAGASGALDGLPLIGGMAPWRVSFILIGLPGLLALALIPVLGDPAPAPSPGDAPTPELLPFVRQNAALVALILFSAGFSAVALGSITGWVPEYMQRSLGMSPMAAGASMGSLLLAAAFIAQGGYSVAVDWCAARGMDDAPVRLGLVPTALAIPLAWLTFGEAGRGHFVPLLAGLLFCVAPLNAMNNTAMQMIAPPALRSRLAALLILVISVIGFSGGPVLVGFLSEKVFGEAQLGEALRLVNVLAMAVTCGLLILLRPRLAAFMASRDRSDAQ